MLGLLVAAGAFAETYTWTDEDGIVHYSDRSHPGAKIIYLGQSTLSRPRPTTSPRGTTTDDAPATASVFSYATLEIASPSAEETLWNIGGTLDVSLSLSPALRPGHQVRAYFDGSPQMVGGANFQLQEVYRGVHNLQVEVVDEAGKLMIRSRPNRFYVQQNVVSGPR